MKVKRKNIDLKLGDILPTGSNSGLSWNKNRFFNRQEKTISSHKNNIVINQELILPAVYLFGKLKQSSDVPYLISSELFLTSSEYANNGLNYNEIKSRYFIKFDSPKPLPEKRPKLRNAFRSFRIFNLSLHLKNNMVFTSIACLIFILVLSIGFFSRALKIKGILFKNGVLAINQLAEAKDSILEKDFENSAKNFEEAHNKFNEISNEFNDFNKIIINTSHYVPFLSKLSSASNLAEAGKNISQIGFLISDILANLNTIKDSSETDRQVSFLKIFLDLNTKSKEIESLLSNIEYNVNHISINDLPHDKQSDFLKIKDRIPEIKGFVSAFNSNSKIFTDILGGNGPRKYLFLFQNNQEMRATGGFIGSYGILDIFDGHVKKFFIDGIFNPDGQLKEKIVPPIPIQKISAAWSLHDSNWFPDFPVSAEKAIAFYEKTGGPTVDGIITLTPTVMQKMLEITGPIEMPDYGLVLDTHNFIENIQTEVEINYDKELNQPKKILSDLAPIILEKLFNSADMKKIARTFNVLIDSLNEKHILLYSTNYELQIMISELGWSGEILDTQKDYLSIINTNINGYKTDGVIEEKILHQAEIQEDGSIIDTVTITRNHEGGNSAFEWWNKVNANYMRLYVPKGSMLISAEGHTREFNSSPLDYNALNFKRDSQVQMEEQNIEVDDESGTRIYTDADKTVFANWVYVSPQETVTVTYKYLLPFKLSLNDKDKLSDTYSLLAQKQSGSPGTNMEFIIKFPNNLKLLWIYPEDYEQKNNSIIIKSDLMLDKFFGIAFSQ